MLWFICYQLYLDVVSVTSIPSLFASFITAIGTLLITGGVGYGTYLLQKIDKDNGAFRAVVGRIEAMVEGQQKDLEKIDERVTELERRMMGNNAPFKKQPKKFGEE